jgi:DNA mismatch repair protein MutH
VETFAVNPLSADLRNQLLGRAESLSGMRVRELAGELGRPCPGGGVHTKGRVGELVELALGASGGSRRAVDFPESGVELKTIPVNAAHKPYESTFVCAVNLDEEVDWALSWPKAKLAQVLFVPVIGEKKEPLPERRFGAPVFWQPTVAQDRQLNADYDDIMGLVGVGRIEDVTAHLGRYMQLRPKAKDGSVRTLARGADGERFGTVPRGFYLRATFTSALLADENALP